jgi:hypothetical protein
MTLFRFREHTVNGQRSSRFSGQTGVPVLVDEANDISGMPESDDIVAYLERTYGN